VFEIVGRETELASLHSFIGRFRRGPRELVLEGDAGIGKSTLWLAGVEQARAQDLRVLSSRPAEVERGFAHVGLGDLLEDVLVDVSYFILAAYITVESLRDLLGVTSLASPGLVSAWRR